MSKNAVFTALFVIGYSLAGHEDMVGDEYKKELQEDWKVLQYSRHYTLGLTPFDENGKEAAEIVCKKYDISLDQWKQLREKLTTPRSLSFFWGLNAFTQAELCIIQKLGITDEDDNTVLMGAVFNQKEELVKKLLATEGADIEAQNRNGNTAKEYISGKTPHKPQEIMARLLCVY